MRSSLSRSRKKFTRGIAFHDFPAKTKIFDLDRPSRNIYLLRSGRVQLARGREAILDYLKPGNFFGEQCLLGPRGQGQIAKTLSPVRVSTFRRADLLDHVQKDRRFSLRLLKNLALRLNRYEESLRDSVTERAERRLARLLFRFLPARAHSGWVRLEFSPSNAELARTIGSTRWRVAHFMGRFQQLGWLDRRPDLWVRVEGIREFLGATL
ncbi:MAG TPA: Crp/Fnr family transcriptional regulator [Bryobacteraceae bacterium]|nr:Crp/Fnr family transcriptional regulator [Bryobacteraceae bacterium]